MLTGAFAHPAFLDEDHFHNIKRECHVLMCHSSGWRNLLELASADASATRSHRAATSLFSR